MDPELVYDAEEYIHLKMGLFKYTHDEYMNLPVRKIDRLMGFSKAMKEVEDREMKKNEFKSRMSKL